MLSFLKQILAGLISYLPGGNALLRARGSGGTFSADYCYRVWLDHLSAAHEAGFDTQPSLVAEIGPGDSLGIGIAALLSGAGGYYALDAVPYAGAARDADIFGRLVELFRVRTRPTPDREFPLHILTEERLGASLAPARLEAIRQAIAARTSHAALNAPIPFEYAAPWTSSDVIREGTADWIYSQAALEHVDRLEECTAAQSRWLRPGGFVTHEIDFDCHWTSRLWNGHWARSDATWKLMRGRRPYLINRAPCSRHVALLEQCGLEIVSVKRRRRPNSLTRGSLAPAFKRLSDEDLQTAGAFIVARKPAE
ncbi:MAG: hypothetical protein NTX50_21975 [Candidatus Sumerlaeota bacterium]|nr:hypothetical protein [Candidatus Sumerlaeota bacterium]